MCELPSQLDPTNPTNATVAKIYIIIQNVMNTECLLETVECALNSVPQIRMES